MNSSLYYNKYLKYKKKYLNLKKQLGGNNNCINLTYEEVMKGIEDGIYSYVDTEKQFENYRKLHINIESEKHFCGSGSFKEVYLGVDIKNNKLIAWHEIDLNIKMKSEWIRFINEIKVMEKLDHPNIIKYINTDHFPISKKLIILTELINGGELLGIISKEILNNSRIASYLKQILEGLKYIHSKNIIHRDIKPNNIMVDNNNIIKIIDFGLATSYDTNDEAQAAAQGASKEEHPQPIMMRQPSVDKKARAEGKNNPMGTLDFMAPEITSEDYNILVDIYSLGMVLGQMILRKNLLLGCKDPEIFFYASQTYKLYKNSNDPAVLQRILDREYAKLSSISNIGGCKDRVPNMDEINREFSKYEPWIRAFFEDCIGPPQMRLNAQQLLNKYFPDDFSVKPDGTYMAFGGKKF